MKAFKKTGKIVALASIASLLTFSAAMAQEVFMEGRVLPTQSGYELLNDRGPSISLVGHEEELSYLVPGTVQITGDLQENATGKTINIHKVENASY